MVVHLHLHVRVFPSVVQLYIFNVGRYVRKIGVWRKLGIEDEKIIIPALSCNTGVHRQEKLPGREELDRMELRILGKVGVDARDLYDGAIAELYQFFQRIGIAKEGLGC